ncbi:LysE family translocator [Flavobacteriaceae bacterium]|jgi:threonine/homoserine/homoserine lactone efflux protein|nr:LysE family translocator [Flavobacteriaceae bacterium]MDA7730823.1 LysE family translocator [Flavobacteriaceae bacterium]MDB4060046.1 LysE family translocator [Flavobacteriaceae bacterium]MDB4131026.1 LysE family translocator [Flavobacteriaceae bacterium]
MDVDVLLTFVLTSLLLTISPGPDIIYVISQSISKGVKSAITTSLGLTSGLLVHTFLVTIGLSLIISQNEYVFNFIRLLGVLYFSYLIILVFISRNKKKELDINNKSSNDFYRGLIMNLLNPKVSLFFIAFFPGFLFHNDLNNEIQFLILGGIFWLQATLVFLLVSLLSFKLNSFSKRQSLISNNIYLFEIGVYIFIIYWIVS